MFLFLLLAISRMFSSPTFASMFATITVRRPASVSAFASTFLWRFAMPMFVITATAVAAAATTRSTPSTTASATMTGTVTGVTTTTTTIVLGTAWTFAFLSIVRSWNGKFLSQFREILQRRTALIFVTRLRILRHVESMWFQSSRTKFSLYQWSVWSDWIGSNDMRRTFSRVIHQKQSSKPPFSRV